VNNTDIEALKPGCKPNLTYKQSLKSDCLIWMLFEDQQRSVSVQCLQL